MASAAGLCGMRLKFDIITMRYPALHRNIYENIRASFMKRIFLITALAWFATAAQAANSGDMNAAELRKAVVGKTLYLSASGIVLPIAYRANGTMRGRLQASVAALAGGSAADTGRWWITDNQLCQRWSHWLKGKSYCYKISRQGRSVVWVRNDGRRGTLRLGG